MYRKIKVSDRKPEVEKVVIGLWNSDDSASRAVVLQESGYWNEAHEGYECDEPDYWLEEVEIESHTAAHTKGLREQLESETESRKHWQSQAQRYHKYHKELNAALERVKELEAENTVYRDRIGEALKFLQSRQQTTPGLGAPVTILKQALEK